MKVKEINSSGLMSTFLIWSAIAGVGMISQQAIASSITEALEKGKPVLDVRLRAEMVDQDGKNEKANALTARTRIGYMSGEFSGFKGYFEFENITAVKDDYNSLTNNKTAYPVVADPEGSEVNQAFLSYGGVKGLTAKVGRQRIILDNARFVGNVGWRQNEQTYDAALLKASMIKDVIATYAFVDGINGITGGSAETDSHLINLSYKGLPATKLTAYSYLIDMESGADNKTLGLSASGKFAVSDSMKMLYAAEVAQMSDYADNDSGNSADYYSIEAGAALKPVTLKLGYEVLGGDGTTSFSTPLATKHKFNGWADVFLKTPDNGLVDMYLTAVGKIKGVKLLAVYHNYSSDTGGDDYGSEINLLAAKKFGKHYTAGVKYANYMAGDIKSDINKIWLWGGLKF